MNKSSSLHLLCTSQYIAKESDYPYCSRFDSMVPPDDYFPRHQETCLEQDAEELSCAMTFYKQVHRRSCLSFQEFIYLLHSLGYQKSNFQDDVVQGAN